MYTDVRTGTRTLWRGRRVGALLAAVSVACGAEAPEGDRDPAPRPWVGVVEGFYGTPYTFEERSTALSFAAAKGLNTWLYAPKLDEFHRDHWRDPYPEEHLAHFGDMARADPRLRFVYAVAPGLDYGELPDDLATLLGKLSAIHARGVRDFCVLFDDIGTGNAGAEPETQVVVLTRVLEHLRRLDPDTSLCFVPNYYFGTPDELEAGLSPFAPFQPHPAADYYAAYRELPSDVSIMWTGRRVFAHALTRADVAAFREYVGRPLVIWDNYPVNDTLFGNELFLGPYGGRDAAMVDHAGVLVNPMREPAATRLPLATFAEWVRNGAEYDGPAALDRAIEEEAGASAAALRRLVAQFSGHPAIGDGAESAALAALVDDFLVEGSASAADALDAHLVELEAVQGKLALPGDLQRELEGPAEKLTRLAAAGRLAVAAVVSAREGPPDLTAFEASVAGALEIPWLVAANTDIPPGLAAALTEHTPVRADVFGRLFSAARAAAAR